MENNFAKNLKRIRESKGLSQSELSRITQKLCDKYNSENKDEKKMTPITQASIARWEAGENSPSIDNIVLLKNALNINLVDLIEEEIIFDNAELVEMDPDNTVMIPVLGVIKAGTPIEAQEDILEYVDIPKSWLRGGKKFYGLKIAGDSMYPKYCENDIVIFEHTNDMEKANGKDCAVMVNGFDATFKTVVLTDNGIQLIPYNPNNCDNYLPTFYSKEEIISKPVNIIGIVKERRVRY